VSPLCISVPCFSRIKPKDTLRVYVAWDAATTGVHTLAAYLLLSDQDVPYQMHSEKSAATGAGQTAGTLTTGVDISTVEGKCRQVLGFGASFLVYPTAAETFGGHINVESDEDRWVTQTMPFGMAGSGLSTQITPFTLPNFMLPLDLKPWFDQVIYSAFPNPFPLEGTGKFTFKNTPIADQTVAGTGRYFLYYTD